MRRWLALACVGMWSALLSAQATRPVTFAWDVILGEPATTAEIERNGVVSRCPAVEASLPLERRCTLTMPVGTGSFRARMGTATEWGPWSAVVTLTVPAAGTPPGAFTIRAAIVPPVQEARVPTPTSGVLDNFNRADGAIGGSWTVLAGGINISSNTAVPTTGGDAAVLSGTYGPSVEFFFTLATKPADGAGTFAVGAVRSGTLSGYGAIVTPLGGGNDTLKIQRFDAGVPTDLATDTTIEVQSGDGLAYQMEGTTHRLYLRQSGVWSLIISTTDSTYTGQTDYNPLLSLVATNGAVDDYSGGNLSVSVGGAAYYRQQMEAVLAGQ